MLACFRTTVIITFLLICHLHLYKYGQKQPSEEFAMRKCVKYVTASLLTDCYNAKNIIHGLAGLETVC